MSFSNYGRLRPQVRFLQRQFLQDGKLPFTDVLSERTVEQALKALNVAWLDRVYSPHRLHLYNKLLDAVAIHLLS